MLVGQPEDLATQAILPNLIVFLNLSTLSQRNLDKIGIIRKLVFLRFWG